MSPPASLAWCLLQDSTARRLPHQSPPSNLHQHKDHDWLQHSVAGVSIFWGLSTVRSGEVAHAMADTAGPDGVKRAPSGSSVPAGIMRAPSDGFRRAPSGGSVTFQAASGGEGGLARVPSVGSAASGSSKKSGFSLTRRASTFTRTSSQGGGVARGGSAGWAKLRSVAALVRPPSNVANDPFSRLPSGFQRVPSANAPGSLGIVVPLTFAVSCIAFSW